MYNDKRQKSISTDPRYTDNHWARRGSLAFHPFPSRTYQAGGWMSTILDAVYIQIDPLIYCFSLSFLKIKNFDDTNNKKLNLSGNFYINI